MNRVQKLPNLQFTKEEVEAMKTYQQVAIEHKIAWLERYREFMSGIWMSNPHLRIQHEAEHDLKYAGFLEIFKKQIQEERKLNQERKSK